MVVPKNSDLRLLRTLLSVLPTLPLITLLTYVLRLVAITIMLALSTFQSLVSINLLVILHGLVTTGALNLPTDNPIPWLMNRMTELNALVEMSKTSKVNTPNNLRLNQSNKANTANLTVMVAINLTMKNYSKLSERKSSLVVLEESKV